MLVQITELGQIMLNFANIVPSGMVVFFPSYAFLNDVRAIWQQSGLMDKLNAKKKVSRMVYPSICDLETCSGFI